MGLLGGITAGIKSIQRGTIAITGATSNTATITSVDLPNSVIHFLGCRVTNGGMNASQVMARIELTNATTVTASVFSSPGAQTNTVSYEVIEYYPGIIKSVQRGTIANSGTATITPVDTTKSQLDHLGWVTSLTSVTPSAVNLVLTNATTVTSIYSNGDGGTVGYQVVEYYP